MTHVVNRRWKKKGKELVGERYNIQHSPVFMNPFISPVMARFVYRGRHGFIVVTDPVEAFQLWLHGVKYEKYKQEQRKAILAQIGDLKGKVLVCCCKPQPCHGDVLAQLAEKT